MKTKDKYSDYFKEHYKLSYNGGMVTTYRKWFYAQWVEIMQHVKFKKSTTVLEIGSAMGTVFSYLREAGVTKYQGLELDKNAVKFTNDFYQTRSFINNSLEDFSTKQKFDFVFAFEVLEHLDNPAESISKIYSLLGSNGYFVGTSPYPYAKNVHADKTHKYVLHPESWKSLFRSTGFREVETYPMSFLPVLWRLNKNLNFKIPFYVSFPGFISTALIIAKK